MLCEPCKCFDIAFATTMPKRLSLFFYKQLVRLAAHKFRRHEALVGLDEDTIPLAGPSAPMW